MRNSSNLRQQATINDGRVIIQPVQGRQISYAAGTTRTFTPGASGNNSGKQRIVTCYNCKGEGHMSKQCTKPRRKRDDSWFKDQVPPSPDYILGPEETQSPPPLDFVPNPMYLVYMPQEDEILLEEPKEDDEHPEEDPADYLADRDDDDEEEEEPSRDDANNEDEDEDKEEEEEEQPALADSDPHVHRMTARISIRDEPSISLPPREEVERLLALTTPPPSPLTPLSSPLPQIPSPPLPASPPASVLPSSPPASPIRPLGYRASMIWLRAEIPSTSHPLPLPTSSPPLQLLSSDRRTDGPEITLPPRKRADYGFVGTMNTEIRRQRAEEVGYGIRDVWVDPREAVEEVAPMTLEGVNTRVTELTAVQEQDTQDIYAVIGDTQGPGGRGGAGGGGEDRQPRYIRV
ncbi:putative reverse transcriptase domain-containing protein [Tanacetum coccineum]